MPQVIATQGKLMVGGRMATSWSTVGQAYMALRARQMDARIMDAMGKPIPELDRQQIERGLAVLKEWVLSQPPYEPRD